MEFRELRSCSGWGATFSLTLPMRCSGELMSLFPMELSLHFLGFSWRWSSADPLSFLIYPLEECNQAGAYRVLHLSWHCHRIP